MFYAAACAAIQTRVWQRSPLPVMMQVKPPAPAAGLSRDRFPDTMP